MDSSLGLEESKTHKLDLCDMDTSIIWTFIHYPFSGLGEEIQTVLFEHTRKASEVLSPAFMPYLTPQG